MDSLLKDLRYAVRMLATNRGFTVVAILSLAFGIGVNTTIFSIVNAVLLRPLNFTEPETLVEVYTSGSDGYPFSTSSYPDFVDYRDQNDVFSALVAHTATPISHNMDDGSELLFGELVSWNYFELFGVQPEVGRFFLPEEDATPETHPVVVLSHGFWQRHFAADAAVLGSTIRLNGHHYTIVGVAPEEFTGTFPVFQMELWVPLMMFGQAGIGDNSSEMLTRRGSRSLFIKGRMRPGVTLEEVEAQIETISARLEQEYPGSNEGRLASAVRLTDIRFHPFIDGALTPIAGLLMVVVGMVLLIACANVANMLLARASVRRREIAIRLALGARRIRLVRQLLTESILLALAGGLGGLLLTYWTTSLMLSYQPPTPISVTLHLGVDVRVLGFTIIASLLTGVIFGLAPALQSSRPDLITALKDESARAGRTWRRFGLRNLLVVTQVAVSLLLLVAAGLFLRSLINAQSVDVGFEDENVAIVSTNPDLVGLSKDEGRMFLHNVLDRAAALPGAEAVAVADRIPLGQAISTFGVYVEGYEMPEGEEHITVDVTQVSPGYFAALSIPMVSGRDLTDADDEGAPGVVVVNATFARRYWPGENPLGKRISRESAEGPWLEVVGVCEDYKVRTIGEEPRPYLHLAAWQAEQLIFPAVLVRTSGDPAPMVGMLRQEILALEPDMVFFETKTMKENIGLMLFPVRFGAGALAIFGLLALGLAAVGLYGVIAYSVSQRTHEIGIRIALGAESSDVLKLVVGQGMRLVIVGVVVGLAGSVAVTGLASRYRYGVRAIDLMSFAGAALVLMAVGFLANYIPARRGASVDPMEALRYE